MQLITDQFHILMAQPGFNHQAVESVAAYAPQKDASESGEELRLASNQWMLVVIYSMYLECINGEDIS